MKTNPHHSQVETIFNAARQLSSPDRRQSYLDLACADDPVLRERVERLLESCGSADGFFERKPVGLTDVEVETETQRSPWESAPVSEGPGTLIGRYKLLQKIGEGGMGVVYMAEQTEPVTRKVALKIIKLGMDSKQVVARFEAERQALAMMDHPNIARVLDGGATQTGRPFFVMELVQGIPITQFCDKNMLPARERLNLFILVCQAIQSAHQKGIIHRDVKPSNVLITLSHGEPTPKVIDFGIAKATNQKLTEKTLFTNYATMIGTPAYMSPEQAEMTSLDVDTRTDVYSLGVLLYELLTGTTPFPEKRLCSAGYGEMRRIIADEEPEKPSTRLSTMLNEQNILVAKSRAMDLPGLRRLLRGDLDWIVMKALEKDRRRRYETANGLATDIQRHLGNEPVVARPPNPFYLLRKLVRRNKLAFAAAGVMVIALMAGIGASTWQALEARKAQRQTESARISERQQRRAAEAAQRIATQERDMARRQRDENLRLLYVADMIAAQQAWDVANLGAAVELLRRHEPGAGEEDLRDFAWQYLKRLCQRGVETPSLDGHRDYIWSVAFSPDGRTLASGSADETVKLWDVATRKERHTLTGHGWAILAVSFSPDGNTLASASPEGTVKLWNPNTGALQHTFEGAGFVMGMAISSRGQLATGTMEGAVTLWDLASGQPRTLFEGEGIRSLAFSADGNTLAFGQADGAVMMRNLESEQGWTKLEGHTSWVRSVAFSPDGTTLASASHDHTVKLWDVMTGKAMTTLKGHRDRLWSVSFSPDGKTLASAGNMVKLWDVSTGKEQDTLVGHDQPVYAVAFSPDGKTLASGSHDTKVKLWDVNTREGRTTLRGHTGLVWDVAVSADSKTLASASEDGTLKLWDLGTGEELNTLRAHTNWVTSVALSPDGRMLASAGDDGAVKLWDVATGKQHDIRLAGHQSPVFDLAFSPDGETLASAGNDAKVKIWNVATGEEMDALEDHASIVWAVAFSPDGNTLASSSDDKTVKLWDLTNGNRRPITLGGHSSVVNSVAFSPDGLTLASGSADDTVKLWDVTTGRERRTIRGHSGQVWTVAFSPDGKTLASGGQDTAIKLLDLATGTQRGTLIGHSATVMSLVFSSDGNTLISGSGDGTVKLWRRNPGAGNL